MGLITVSGEPGSRHEEVARLAAHELGFELVSDARLNSKIREEFGETPLPEDAWQHVATSLLARLATERHLIICCEGAERLFTALPSVLRVRVVAPESIRVGALMIDRGLDRNAARAELRQMEGMHKRTRSAKAFDIVLNAERLSTDEMASVIAATAQTTSLKDAALLPFATEAQLQFQSHLALAGHGIAPPHAVTLKRRDFSHPSEEIFANLLDFYRIAWEYEPRSFPIEWDSEGKITEAFTPDFYLPEFDTYIELTTMKQSLVTRKNRKVRRLKAVYPQINIQIFYQKDFENLNFKYGLSKPSAVTTAQ